MRDIPFSQTLFGAVLVGVLVSLVVGLLNGDKGSRTIHATKPVVQLQNEEERPPAAIPSPPMTLIQSNVPGAETYLNWKKIGKTPFSFDSSKLNGILILIKDKHEAAYRNVKGSDVGDNLSFVLYPSKIRPANKVILFPSADEELFALRSGLAQANISVVELGNSDIEEIHAAGGISFPPVRLWLSARYDCDYLLQVSQQHTVKDLSRENMGDRSLQNSLRGAFKGEIALSLRALDLQSGSQIASSTSSAFSFGLTPSEALEKALSDASSIAVHSIVKQLEPSAEKPL